MMAALDHNGHPLPVARVRTIEQAVNACYRNHVANASKRGRNPRYPYVPIIITDDTRAPGRKHQSQIQAVAYATRDEAVGYAQMTINFWRDRFRKQLIDPRMNAIRRQWGVSNAECSDPDLADRLARIFGDGEARS
jgi:hypothetical protein